MPACTEPASTCRRMSSVASVMACSTAAAAPGAKTLAVGAGDVDHDEPGTLPAGQAGGVRAGPQRRVGAVDADER